MRFFQKTKDGGPESTVDALFLVEIKSLFSIAILRFNKGSRNNYHSHAFHALTWFLFGDMDEHRMYPDGSGECRKYTRSIIPKVTTRDNMHKVVAFNTSWCVTVRGPWSKTWKEIDPSTEQVFTLTHGRKIVEVYNPSNVSGA